MSNAVIFAAYTAAIIIARLSFRVGKGHYKHNLRETSVLHADLARIVDNIVFIRQTLDQAYKTVFGEAEREYREMIGASEETFSYLERRRENKWNKVDYEILVMIGNKFNCGLNTEGWRRAAEVLKEYMEGFQKRNPNLYVYCTALHLDEQTPHLHIMIIPFADGYKRGMRRQFSFSGALEAQGFEKKLYQREHWKDSERAILEEIMRRHGMERAPDLGLRRAHLPIEMFKAYVENLDNRIMNLPQQITRLRGDRKEVTVLVEELDQLELRAKISPLYVESARNLIEELEKEKKECKNYLKYLDSEYDKLLEEQAKAEKVIENARVLWEAYQSQKQQSEALEQRCNNYEHECQQEREYANLARKERDSSNKALAEVTQAVSMLIDPYAWGYEIRNLDEHSRKVIQAIVKRGKRALQEAGVEIDTSVGRDIYDVRLPDGISREMYMQNEQEEWER